MLVSFAGMAVALFMFIPTPGQLATAEATGKQPIVGAHGVGVEDGGPGLPIVGWSTTGGDLRVPHFVGLHALQVLPLIGVLIAGFGPRWLRPDHRVALVWTAGLGYLGLVLLLTWQALRGQPVVAPDAPTLGLLLVLVAAVFTSAFFVIRQARRTRRRTNGWATRNRRKRESTGNSLQRDTSTEASV